jgi:hypothetical protein
VCAAAAVALLPLSPPVFASPVIGKTILVFYCLSFLSKKMWRSGRVEDCGCEDCKFEPRRCMLLLKNSSSVESSTLVKNAGKVQYL